MSTLEHRQRACAVAALVGALATGGSALADSPKLGTPLDASALTTLKGRSIYPDGRGLPPGHGSVAEGRLLYAQRCLSCHGVAGRGGSGGHLISGEPLSAPDADAGIDNYWPYATTLFDFTRRAMPMDAPGSLSDNEVYALTAYLLNLGGIVGAEAVMTAETLPRVRMPNRDGFVWIDAKRPRPPKR